jgi:hypothetical protein
MVPYASPISDPITPSYQYIVHQSTTKYGFLRIFVILCYHDKWPTKMTGLTWQSPKVTSRSSMISVHDFEAYHCGWDGWNTENVKNRIIFTLLTSQTFVLTDQTCWIKSKYVLMYNISSSHPKTIKFDVKNVSFCPKPVTCDKDRYATVTYKFQLKDSKWKSESMEKEQCILNCIGSLDLNKN